jgi:hypothetical protein
MPLEESLPTSVSVQPTFELGQEVLDKEGKRLGKIQARFRNYILVERGGLFVKAYYVPHGAIRDSSKAIILLSLSENDLKRQGLNSVPDDLYNDTPEPGRPDLSGVAQFARRPLSPAETGHYNYGRRWPGINTDASGSYPREEVLPIPQKYVQGEIFTTDLPIPPREISSN